MGETGRRRAVFVYGTLRPGQCNWPLLDGRTERVVSGRLPGVVLVDCGGFPAAVERPDGAAAVGEVVWVRADVWPSVLSDLDHLEGYVPAGPDCLFDRVVRSVLTAVGTVECWVYLAGRRLAASGGPVVAGGDWVAHGVGLPYRHKP